MVIKGSSIEEVNLRKGYDLPAQDRIGHFAVRVTTPHNPFEPAPHGEWRFWYILEGTADVTIDGEVTRVEPGDLVLVPPWSQHSLRAAAHVRWICFG